MRFQTLQLKKFKFDRYQSDAVKICIALQKQGYAAYWVGGAARDLLLKRKHSDIDIATAAEPKAVKQVLKALDFSFFNLGEKFGTIGAISRAEKKQIEITTFRTEKDYFDFRHPAKVNFVSSPEKDALRRDFTVNSLYFDPRRFQILDYTGGINDINKKKLRFVGNAKKRISEDPLRLLRAVRISSELNFKIAPADTLIIKKSANLLNKIPAERIKAELDKIIISKNRVQAIKLLDATGLLKIILPELERLKKTKQSKNFHAEGSAFVHSLRVFENAQSSTLVFLYAALLHDIGKFNTGLPKMRAGRKHISFPGHAQQSAEMFKKIAVRLKFSAKEREEIIWLIAHHMDLRHLDKLSEKTLMRWSQKEHIQELIRLRISDDLGAQSTNVHGKPVKRDLSPFKKLAAKLKRYKKLAAPKLVSGNEVMRILKIRPGRGVGAVLFKIKELQQAGKIRTKQQVLKFLKSLDSKSVRD